MSPVMPVSPDAYAAFLVVCLVAVVVPGPTNTLIVANGIRHGVRAGLLNVAGTQAGVAAMIAVACFGLTSAIELAGHWFEWIKLLGAAYLVWIGVQMLRSAAAGMAAQSRRPSGGFFLQGLLVSLGNPKQLLFFGALMPQFIDPSRDATAQIVLLGVTALAFAAVSDGAYALAASRIGRSLDARRIRLVSRIGGASLIGGGVWLAFARAR